MKTIWAVFSHFGFTALQAIALTEFFDSSTPNSFLKNKAIQIGAQALLSGVQAAIAVNNSSTDPNGKPLVESSPNHFQTEHK